MTDKRIKADGGWRWEFERSVEDPPVAMKMEGKRCKAKVRLSRIRTRKLFSCKSCKSDISPGEDAWRQMPGTSSGYSRFRWCDRCVEHGAPRPPGPPLEKCYNPHHPSGRIRGCQIDFECEVIEDFGRVLDAAMDEELLRAEKKRRNDKGK